MNYKQSEREYESREMIKKETKSQRDFKEREQNQAERWVPYTKQP